MGQDPGQQLGDPVALTGSAPAVDPVEAALAEALRGATAAGRWDVVTELARNLEARRVARLASNVVPIDRGRSRAT